MRGRFLTQIVFFSPARARLGIGRAGGTRRRRLARAAVRHGCDRSLASARENCCSRFWGSGRFTSENLARDYVNTRGVVPYAESGDLSDCVTDDYYCDSVDVVQAMKLNYDMTPW